MPDVHALLGPSGAKRWMSCPPSARLEEQFSDSDSEYAAEGTLAHNLAETILLIFHPACMFAVWFRMSYIYLPPL